MKNKLVLVVMMTLVMSLAGCGSEIEPDIMENVESEIENEITNEVSVTDNENEELSNSEEVSKDEEIKNADGALSYEYVSLIFDEPARVQSEYIESHIFVANCQNEVNQIQLDGVDIDEQNEWMDAYQDLYDKNEYTHALIFVNKELDVNKELKLDNVEKTDGNINVICSMVDSTKNTEGNSLGVAAIIVDKTEFYGVNSVNLIIDGNTNNEDVFKVQGDDIATTNTNEQSRIYDNYKNIRGYYKLVSLNNEPNDNLDLEIDTYGQPGPGNGLGLRFVINDYTENENTEDVFIYGTKYRICDRVDSIIYDITDDNIRILEDEDRVNSYSWGWSLCNEEYLNIKYEKTDDGIILTNKDVVMIFEKAGN